MFDFLGFVKKNEFYIFLSVLVLGLFGRLILFIVLPEATHSDAVFHLSIVRTILETGSIENVQKILPMPLYHFILTAFFTLTNLPVTMPFIRIIPFFVSAIQIIITYLICKDLFPNQKNLQLFGVAFSSAHVVLSIFSTVNYTGPIATVFMLLSFWLFIRIYKSLKINYSEITLFILSVFLLSLTKLNATIVVPVFFFGLAYILHKKKLTWVTIVGFLSLMIILCTIWPAFNYLTLGSPLGFSSSELTQGVSQTIISERITFERATFFYFNFFGVPGLSDLAKSGFSEELLFLFPFVFFIGVLPLVLAILLGIYLTFKKKKLPFVLMILLILFVLPIVVKRGFESRLLMPVIPFFGILAAYAFSNLKNKFFVSLVIISFLFFGLFSFVYVSGSAYYFNSQHEKVSDLYSYISKLPDNSKILSTSEHRKINFYTGKEAQFIHSLNQFTDKEQFISASSQKEFSHFAISCTDEYEMNADLLKILVEDNTLELIYSDECSSLYRINYETIRG